MQKQQTFFVSPAPHVFSKDSTAGIMRDVIIALLPACVAGCLFFGWRALGVLVAAVLSAVLAEAVYQRLVGKPVTVGDGSAIITGLLLGMNLPSTVPIYVPILGSVFAIVIVKQVFGGLGDNFVNPAIAGRMFLTISFAGTMTTFVPTVLAQNGAWGASAIDALSTATPLAIWQHGSLSRMPELWQVFLGNHPGVIGETSSLALIIGGIYLLWRRVIEWRIPATYLSVVFVMTFLIKNPDFSLMVPVYHLFSGGLLLGAVFMATDYVTSPMSRMGRIVYGVGCGLLTGLFRLFGDTTEGVTFAILVMNVVTPLIDRYMRSKVFAEVKPHA